MSGPLAQGEADQPSSLTVLATFSALCSQRGLSPTGFARGPALVLPRPQPPPPICETSRSTSSDLPTLLFISPMLPGKWCCLPPHFTERKLRFREFPSLAPNYPARKRWAWCLNPGSMTQPWPEVLAIIHLLHRQVRPGSFSFSHTWGNSGPDRRHLLRRGAKLRWVLSPAGCHVGQPSCLFPRMPSTSADMQLPPGSAAGSRG